MTKKTPSAYQVSAEAQFDLLASQVALALEEGSDPSGYISTIQERALNPANSFVERSVIINALLVCCRPDILESDQKARTRKVISDHYDFEKIINRPGAQSDIVTGETILYLFGKDHFSQAIYDTWRKLIQKVFPKKEDEISYIDFAYKSFSPIARGSNQAYSKMAEEMMALLAETRQDLIASQQRALAAQQRRALFKLVNDNDRPFPAPLPEPGNS